MSGDGTRLSLPYLSTCLSDSYHLLKHDRPLGRRYLTVNQAPMSCLLGPHHPSNPPIRVQPLDILFHAFKYPLPCAGTLDSFYLNSATASTSRLAFQHISERKKKTARA